MSKHQHFKICKPFGYISQFVSNQRYAHKKKYLGELYNFPQGSMAIGRLDEASEGLLLITTDGIFSEEVRSNQIEKEYWVQVDGMITEEAIDHLKAGPKIKTEGKIHHCSKAKVLRLPTPNDLPLRKKPIRGDHHGPSSWVSISIGEGKFRQIRKMTAAVGFPTLRLIRVRIGQIKLENMGAGDCIELSEEERNYFRRMQ